MENQPNEPRHKVGDEIKISLNGEIAKERRLWIRH